MDRNRTHPDNTVEIGNGRYSLEDLWWIGVGGTVALVVVGVVFGVLYVLFLEDVLFDLVLVVCAVIAGILWMFLFGYIIALIKQRYRAWSNRSGD